jgi:hypothetical protein
LKIQRKKVKINDFSKQINPNKEPAKNLSDYTRNNDKCSVNLELKQAKMIVVLE